MDLLHVTVYFEKLDELNSSGGFLIPDGLPCRFSTAEHGTRHAHVLGGRLPPERLRDGGSR